MSQENVWKTKQQKQTESVTWKLRQAVLFWDFLSTGGLYSSLEDSNQILCPDEVNPVPVGVRTRAGPRGNAIDSADGYVMIMMYRAGGDMSQKTFR